MTQEQVMVDSGYIRSKHTPGKWVLPQEEELLEKRKKVAGAQLEWNAKLKRYSTWLGTDKGPQAVAAIKAIDDPFAVNAIGKQLEIDQRQDVRLLYLQALGRINAADSMNMLVGISLHDRDDEIRAAARDEVVARGYQPAVGQYVQALKSKDNAVINRAAEALGLLKDPAAINPLIDALVTNHTYVIQKGQAGQMSSTFGSGPGAAGADSASAATPKRSSARSRTARAAIAGRSDQGTSFSFDVKAWKYWYLQKKPKTGARRDSSQ